MSTDPTRRGSPTARGLPDRRARPRHRRRRLRRAGRRARRPDPADHRAAARGLRSAVALERRLRGDPRRLGSDRRADRRDRAGARATCSRRCAPVRHVVTANKQLLSQYGEELFAAAGERGVQLRFEGAVAGVVPVIRVLQESLAGARIDRVHGIVNGTTNFILSEMARLGITFEEALAEAQRLGYAEADPSDDVDGRDAAAKMAILARLAFGAPVHLDQVRYEGIRQITPDDMEYARELGLGLKLIGTAERIGDGAVGPRASRVPVPGPPAGLDQRAVQRGHRRVAGDHRDHHVRPGRGRAADGDRGARRRHQRDDPAGQRRPRRWSSCRSSRTSSRRFYLHLEVADEPGVLAQVAQRPRRPRRVGQVGGAEGPERPGAAGDGRPPGARVAVLRRDGRDRRARRAARAAALDPRARGGVLRL